VTSEIRQAARAWRRLAPADGEDVANDDEQDAANRPSDRKMRCSMAVFVEWSRWQG
jgi:hypothetical protein